ncbi:lysozyme [Acinetobacter sp. ANC 3832]|uniref:lysozyme n=1 Tax=Acinetobacter sp. ANC 3832 TaxID=1977874 RepID=UPI000A333D8D|nr:lysozyme [Acinetobacter sp. ANC 3832]OTG94981.1 lysozyme [Acinetobacter sp. ANC 3832]
MSREAFFGIARTLAGGSLTQEQVNKLNDVLTFIVKDGGNNKTVSKSGVDIICGFEGKELKAYDDGVGVWTIGFGTTIYPDGIKVKKGDVCTLEQAKSYMAHDLKKFEQTVNTAVVVPLNQNQFDALVSLTYNIGQTAFKDSTLLKKLNAGDYLGAAAQFNVWNKVKGKIVQGLVNRRAKERKLFEKAL